MRPKYNHWYVIAWTDSPPSVGLCVQPSDGRFYFPEKNGRSRRAVDYVDSQSQLIFDLGEAEVPNVPRRLSKFQLDE